MNAHKARDVYFFSRECAGPMAQWIILRDQSCGGKCREPTVKYNTSEDKVKHKRM